MSDRLNYTRLRSWRIENGFTLTEIGDLSGLSPSMLSRAERGERTLSPMARVRTARALGVRVADLFEPEGRPVDDRR